MPGEHLQRGEQGGGPAAVVAVAEAGDGLHVSDRPAVRRVSLPFHMTASPRGALAAVRYNRKMIRISLLAALAASALCAQDWAVARLEKSPRHREWVTVKHDGRAVETFIAYPESKDKTPVVLVIHEIFGMSDWVQEVADEFAAAGYIAVAPDLLSGMAPGGKGTKGFQSNEVMQAIGHLPPDQIMADLNAVTDYALKLPASTGKAFRGGLLLGRRTDFPFRYESPRYRRRAGVLRTAARQGGHEPH